MKPENKNNSSKQPPLKAELIQPMSMDKFEQMVQARICELFSGCVVFGFRADTGAPIIIYDHQDDTKTAMSLNQFISNDDVNVPMPGEE